MEINSDAQCLFYSILRHSGIVTSDTSTTLIVLSSFRIVDFNEKVLKRPFFEISATNIEENLCPFHQQCLGVSYIIVCYSVHSNYSY